MLRFGSDGLIVEARDYSHAEPGEIQPHTRMFLPGHLRPAVEDLHRAYPGGLREADYLPLLAALHDEFSDHNLAAVGAAFLGGDPIVVANDAAANPTPPGEAARVREFLRVSGWPEPDE